MSYQPTNIESRRIMTETIKTLLQPIQNRLNAATPGPWEMEESRYSISADTYRIIGIERFRGYTNDVSLGEDKATAVFIAAAPTDQARLLAAVQAVDELHRPSKRWEPYEGAGYTFLTREQALEASGEEDLGVVAIEAGPQFFEVCAECARVESEQLSETGEEWGYREALWPCPPVAAVVAALTEAR